LKDSFSLSDGRVKAARSWAAAFFLGHTQGKVHNIFGLRVLNTCGSKDSLIYEMLLGGNMMNTWRKKFFAFLLALIAVSVFAGPIAVSTSAAPAPAAQHGKRHHHRRRHPRRRHHR
jgi:hypothetical protein